MEKEFDIEKIKLIVGLGNIGKRYKRTRHNVGFMFLDSLATEEFREETKFFGLVSVGPRRGVVLRNLLKPTTLMNRSGKAVAAHMQYFDIKPEEILLAHDDLDLELGRYKIQLAKGPKIHNGVISVEKSIATDQFWRLRIGVDNRTKEQRENMEGNEYVLARFSTEEIEKLNILFEEIKNQVLVKSDEENMEADLFEEPQDLDTNNKD